MQLHKHIQPHHHITIWAACALLIILSATIAGSPVTTTAQDSSSSGEFFDETRKQEGIVEFFAVAECKRDSDRIKDTVAKETALYAESSRVINELDSLRDKFQPTDAERARIAELEAKLAQIESDLAANKAVLEKISNKTGPSDECKTAFVKEALKNIRTHAEKQTRYIVKLDQISAVVATIEKALPELRKSTTNEALIKSIESDIATIKSSVTTLKSFFNDMKTEMDSFLALADNNPPAAYDKMNQSGQDDTRFKKSDGVVQTMLSAFTRLKNSINILAQAPAGAQTGTKAE